VRGFEDYNNNTMKVLYSAYDAAWLELEEAADPRVSQPNKAVSISQLTRGLLAAANAGERDFERLKLAALQELS
jgi:hypothetical protein